MKTKNKYTISTKGNFIKIFISGILHFSINQKELLSIQSWINGNDWYCIEIYTEHREILLEYDDFKKWTSIINLLNNAIQ